MKPTCKITQSEFRSYREVRGQEAANYEWECALIVTDEDPSKTVGQYCSHRGGCGNDYKYSRGMVNRQHKVRRGMSILEFYGDGIVD